MYTESELIEAVKQSLSISETLNRLNLSKTGSSFINLKKKILLLKIDTSHFHKTVKNVDLRARHWSTLLVFDNKIPGRIEGYRLTKALIESGREYKCEKCSNIGEWQGESLKLEVDHIDGNWRNNLPDNLRFLCPNCHSLTPNFFHKKQPRPKKGRTGKLTNKITKEELEVLLWQKSTVKIAESLDVSDKAIEKLARKWGLRKPPRGYWAKQNRLTGMS